MINIGFWYDEGLNYSGGLNYYYNLIYAFSKVKQNRYKIFFFFPSDLDSKTKKKFYPYCSIIKVNALKKNSIISNINKIFIKLFNINLILLFYFWKYKINIFSHSKSIYKIKFFNFKVINWIPDFQYIYLKHLFDEKSFNFLDQNTKKILTTCDHLILSSDDAFNHLKKNYKVFVNYNKISVLNFVSQITTDIKSNNFVINKIISNKFFYLPNQFWSHKNHLVVFKSIKILQKKIHNIILVCSGNPLDYKNNTTKYFDSLNNFIKENNLEKNIINLGLIDYDDVNVLMKNCISIINPSYFEGWSSTVEEAKSFNKNIILSNIDIHKEQNPKRAHYFDKDDYNQLSHIMEDLWNKKNEEHLDQNYNSMRTSKFGREYYKIVNLVNNQN